MKNIILLDPTNLIFEHIKDINDIYIPVLVLVHQSRLSNMNQELINKKVGNILFSNIPDYATFLKLYKSDYNLKKEDIELYRFAQLKVERFAQREVLDAAEAQYRYLIGLTYFLGIFENYTIDAIISGTSEHGWVWDSVVYEIAKQRNIPIFIASPELATQTYMAWNFRCLNNKHLLNLRDYHLDYNFVELENYAHKLPFNNVVQDKKKECLLDIDAGKNLSIFTTYFKKGFYENTQRYELPFRLRDGECLQNFKYLKRLESIYANISQFPEQDEKYVFYALHFEPEAQIINRSTFTSQLHIIKLISECLPANWKLYVKEHPHQFNLKDDSYFLRNIFLFRTEQFYRNIIDNQNVLLIKDTAPSIDLIKNAQAVATICGSVIPEAMAQSKPILIFGTESTVFSECEQSFNIYSKNDIRNALNAIENGFVPEYSDLNEVCKKYLFQTNHEKPSEGYKFIKDLLPFLLQYKI